MRYDELILGNLLDSYENSLLSSGKNKVQIHISMSFSKKNMPEYFDESSLIYEERIKGILQRYLKKCQRAESYGRKLTENDNRRLDKLLEKISEDSEKDRCADVISVLKYMKITQLKLEQECIECAESLF